MRAVKAPEKSTCPAWGCAADIVNQGLFKEIVNQSGFSQTTRELRGKAMSQAKGTACAKAQRAQKGTFGELQEV